MTRSTVYREPTHATMFDHGVPDSTPRARRITAVTRYLCGAAYIEEAFADKVIEELIENPHRAVAPASGYDLNLVVRHCYRARRLWLMQNVVLAAVLVVALVVAPSVTFGAVSLCLLISVLTWVLVRGRADRASWKIAVVAGLLLLVLPCLLSPMLAILSMTGGEAGSMFGSPQPTVPTSSSLRGPVAGILLLTVILATVVTVTRLRMQDILATELMAEGPARAPEPPGGRVAQRVAEVAGAQHGNILLHSGYRPFLGAGQVNPAWMAAAWSLALELRLAPGARPGEQDESGSLVGPPRLHGVAVPVDPVALNQHVKRRLAALRDSGLPERERVLGLTLRDQIIASGTRWRDYPLVDQRTHTPFCLASPDAMHLIITHPQASARHFLRIMVSTDAHRVVSGGEVVLPEQSETLLVTVFIHIAVEGGMLYLEFVPAVLSPIRSRYRDIDRFAADRAGGLVGLALKEGLASVGPNAIMAPFRLARAGVRTLTGALRMRRADRDVRDEPVYDYGARLDIREAASSETPDTYVQRLDIEKYIKLIDKRVTEAVLDFLDDRHIDTTEFRARINFLQDNRVTIGGDVHGSVVAGRGNILRQVQGAARR